MTEEEFKSNWLAIPDDGAKTFGVEYTDGTLAEIEILKLFEMNNFTFFTTKTNQKNQSKLTRSSLFRRQNDIE